MSPLAKVFVVVNLVLVIFFTGQVATIFSSSSKWRQESESFTKRALEDAEKWKVKAADYDGVIANLEKDRGALKEDGARLTALNSEQVRQIEELKTQLATTQTEVKTLGDRIGEKDKYIAQKDDENVRLTKQGEDLRNAAAAAAKAEDSAKLTASRAMLDKQELAKQSEQLAILAENYKRDLDDNKATLALVKERYPDIYASVVVVKPAPPIEGLVLEYRPDAALAVLSVGADQKVEVGHQFTGYRGDKLVGKLEVQRVTADLSGAKVLWLEPGAGGFQPGDKVSTMVGN